MSASDSHVVAEILERVSLREVVEEYVSLKKAGREYKGLCPFHQEKTPSFHVIENKRFFYCFGCQTGGDVIKFLQLAAGLSRREAIHRLARRAGITLREDWALDAKTDAAERHRADLLHVLQVAQVVFRANLDAPGAEAARACLKERGVAPDLVERYGIGYGGDGRGTLAEALTARKVSLARAEEAGLLSRPRSLGDSFFERFAGRLTFPIFNLDGAVIAFSGRLLPSQDGSTLPDVPKYLNSPESAVFQKGDAIFGLYQARSAIRRERRVVLVEGNFDVLAAVAAGVENTVAPLGTALTSSQVRTLKRFAGSLVLMFDGDDAGRKASRRAVSLLVEAGVEGHVAVLPPGQDPDSLRRSEGDEALRGAVGRATPMVTWLIESLLEANGRTPHGLRAVVDEASVVFAQERDPFRFGLYCEELARLVGVDVRRVRKLLRRPQDAVADGEEKSGCPPAERTLLELFLLHPRFIHDFFESGDPSWVTDRESRGILADLMNRAIQGLPDAEVVRGFVEASRGLGGLRAEVIEVFATPDKYAEDSRETTYAETVAELEKAALVRQRAPMVAALELAQREGREEDVLRLLTDLSALNRRIAGLHRIAVRRRRSAVRGETHPAGSAQARRWHEDERYPAPD